MDYARTNHSHDTNNVSIKEDPKNLSSSQTNNSAPDFYASQFISQIMLRAEHPELKEKPISEMMPDALDTVNPNQVSSTIEVPLNIDTTTGLIIDFNHEIHDLQQNKPNSYREYANLVDNLKDNLRQISELEQNLIRKHIRSGKYLNDIQAWFEITFGSTYRWTNFVPFLLSQIGSGSYTLRTAQRDMMLYRNLGAYEELLVSAGNSGLAISTIYLLANPDQVSDFALDWSLGLIQDQVNAQKLPAAVQVELDKRLDETVFVVPDPAMTATKSVLPGAITNLSNMGYNYRNQMNNTKQQLTLKHAKNIAETASVIENEIDPKKRPIIKDIARRHQIVNPEMVKELAKQDDETLEEIRVTGHIEYPVEVDTIVQQRNIPISQASTTDLMMMRGEIDDEKHKRYLQHRIDGAKERELLTKGIVSEKVDVVDMKNISEDQHARIAAFIQQNPDLQDILLPLMNTIRTAQGSAGVRAVVCRLDYAPLASSSPVGYKN